MYQSDLSDKEWDLIKSYFYPTDTRGCSYKHEKKIIVDAILYVVEGGIKWRMMPNDFPPWKTVYDHFSKWNKSGVWETALDEMNRVFRKKKMRCSRSELLKLWTPKALRPNLQVMRLVTMEAKRSKDIRGILL